jgi:hypothetical protein
MSPAARRRHFLPALAAAAVLGFGLFAAAQDKSSFRKENRDGVICAILSDIARTTGGTASVADSGSGKSTSDMDVTGKLVLRRPDGTMDNDMTSRFFAAAKGLFPDNDFEIDAHGSIRSKKLDTAVHDAKNAVPDFHCALPPEEFRIKYMTALNVKLQNPDAYFTAGGNRKQVDQRMQSKSRLRLFRPDGSIREVQVDRQKPAEYEKAMKTYYEMNPEEVVSRRNRRDLFGDAFDAYRQAREPGHESDPDHVRGDPKYNTRIVNDYLESQNLPASWDKLTPAQKGDVLKRLFPDEAHAAGRARIQEVLDHSFNIYANRDLAGSSAVTGTAEFQAFSEMFQRGAIAAMAGKRIPDLLNPKVSLQDIKDNAQAIAQKEGKVWAEMTTRQRLDYLQKARAAQPELEGRLKFAAAGELAMVFKSLDGMDTARAARLKEQVMASVPPEQRAYVQSQMDLAMSYLRDASNRRANGEETLRSQKAALDKVRAANLLSAGDLDKARRERGEGLSFRKLMSVAGATRDAYRAMEEKWAALKANLDPTSLEMAGTLDKLDKAHSVLNLIKVWQDSNGDPEALKRAVYMEAMGRYVPGYNSLQLYKMWKSGDPAAQEEVQKSLVFQGLTLLPGGAIARVMKLAVDVTKIGLEVSLGYVLQSAGQENAEIALRGGTFDSILTGIPGRTVEERRRNLFGTWRKTLDLEQAFRRLNAQKRVWNALLPEQKALKVNQDRYRRTTDAFFEKVHREVTARVEGYLGGTTLGRGETAVGTKDILTQMLFADFVNGLNREMGAELLAAVQREARESASVLETLDDCLYGLFSKSLDALIDSLAGDEAPLPVQGRWDLRFGSPKTDKDKTTGETTLEAAAQVIPPLYPTAEERGTTYQLSVPEGKELETQIINGRVRFRLRHPKTQVVVCEKEFAFDLPEEKSDWLALLQKTTKVTVGFSGGMALDTKSSKYGETTTNRADDASQRSDQILTAESEEVTWSGSSFTGFFKRDSQPWGMNQRYSSSKAISGTVDVRRKVLTSLKVTDEFRHWPEKKMEYSSGETGSLVSSLELKDVPLIEEKQGFFYFRREGPGCGASVAGFSRLYKVSGWFIIGSFDARKYGLTEGSEQTYERSETSGQGDLRLDLSGAGIRISLTPTGKASLK